MAIALTSPAEGTGAAEAAPPWKGLRCLLSYALNIHITKKERVWWRGSEAARRMGGRKGRSFGLEAAHPRASLPSPPPKSWRSRTRAPAVLSLQKKKRKRNGDPLWGKHSSCSGARCVWGYGSAPPSSFLPLPAAAPPVPARGVGPSAAGAAGRGGCGWR